MRRFGGQASRCCVRAGYWARGGGCLVRPAYILLETVVATGLLIVGLAVLGAQVQDAQRSVRQMHRKIRAMMLAEQQLAELEMGLVTLESVDEVEEGDFGPRFPDWGWELTTQRTAIDEMLLQRLDIMFLMREGEYREDDFAHEDAEIVFTVYAMRPVPEPIHFGRDFGLREEEMIDLSERLAALGIEGLDVEAFDPRFLQQADFEELVGSLPLIMDALGMEVDDLMSMIPPDLMRQLKDSGVFDGEGGLLDDEDADEGQDRR